MIEDGKQLLKWPPFAMLLVVILTVLYVYLQVYPTKTSNPILMYPVLKLQDSFFKARLWYNEHFRKDYPKESVVTMIVSDEETLSKIEVKEGKEYVSHDTPFLALLIERLSEYQPKVIVLDIAFSDEGAYEGRQELIEAIKKAGNVLMPYDTTGMEQSDKDVLDASLDYGRADIYSGTRTIDDVSRIYYPSGYVKGGIAKVLPLAIKTFLAYQDMPLNLHYYRKEINTILFASKEKVIALPLSEDKMVYINFLYDENMIPAIPMRKVVEGDFDPRLLKGKIALVGMTGVTANSYPDIHSTPIGKIPGCVLMANQINSLVHSYLFREVRKEIHVIILTIFGLILAFLLYKNSMVRGLVILIALILLAIVVSFALFLHNILWSAWYVIALSAIVYLAILIHKASIWGLEQQNMSKNRR